VQETEGLHRHAEHLEGTETIRRTLIAEDARGLKDGKPHLPAKLVTGGTVRADILCNVVKALMTVLSAATSYF
jgi:hypothetical protein